MKKEKEGKKKLIIVHGWKGSPLKGWKPWLKTEMETRGWEVLVPEMPNPAQPEQSRWVSQLVNVAGKVDADTYMVGHSLGSITILRFLERLADNQKIGGAVFVAGFSDPPPIMELRNFFEEPILWSKITPKSKSFVVIHSRDDGPEVTTDKAQNLARNTKARLVLLEGWKHFSSSDGVTNAPPILEELLRISK
jgi:predicted alpha/beta hydrolase family esterase